MRKWLPLVAICLGTFMLLIDVTIVNVALPQMATDLDTSFSSLQWVVDAYALALAALLLGAGTIGDMFGRRLLYVAGLAVFAASSLACGAAPNAAALITARTVQGIGGAAMFATTIALLNIAYQGKDRAVAFGFWGAVSGAASAMGPIVGGLLTEHFSWRWIFFVNLPISLLAIGLTLAVIVDSAGHRARLDLPGILSFTAFAGAATYGMIRASDAGWGDGGTLAMFGIALVALAAFVAIELRRTDPVLDLGLFRSASFVGIIVASALLTFSAFAYLTYSGLWLQSVLGLSPLKAGLVTLPLSGAAFVVAAASGRLLGGVNPRWPIGGGLLLIGIGALAQTVLDADSSWRALLLGLAIAGVGVGLGAPMLTSTGMAAVPMRRGGMAAGAINTARQLGFAFGIALLGSVFHGRAEQVLRDHGAPDPAGLASAISSGQAQRVIGSTPNGQRGVVNGLVHTAFASGLDSVVLVAGIVGLVAGVIVLLTVKPAAAPPWEREQGAGSGAPQPEGVPAT